MFGPKMIQTWTKKNHSHNLYLQKDPHEMTGSTNIFDDLPSLKPSEATELQTSWKGFSVWNRI
jgi:hypothetical protein